jgi:hypothetical protein
MTPALGSYVRVLDGAPFAGSYGVVYRSERVCEHVTRLLVRFMDGSMDCRYLASDVEVVGPEAVPFPVARFDPCRWCGEPHDGGPEFCRGDGAL